MTRDSRFSCLAVHQKTKPPPSGFRKNCVIQKEKRTWHNFFCNISQELTVLCQPIRGRWVCNGGWCISNVNLWTMESGSLTQTGLPASYLLTCTCSSLPTPAQNLYILLHVSVFSLNACSEAETLMPSRL